jgi:hypothetical protein
MHGLTMRKVKSMRSNRLGFSLVLVLLVGLLGIRPGHAVAEEQHCGEIGAACICSEPFNTASYVGGPDFFNPADSTTKECSVEPASIGGAVVRTSATIVGSNDATALSRLPSGHRVTRFLTANNNHEGTFFAGSGVPVSSSIVRLAARWYVYHSPSFAFKTDSSSSCQNTKIMEFDGDSRIDYTGGFHTYNYLQFSPAVDCCVTGPGPNSGLAPSQMQGKWWRWEVVLTNRSGLGYRMMMYGKNVTDNSSEITIMDTSMNGAVANLRPPMLMSKMVANNHRWSPSGSGCAGWRGISHYMMAGWTSDAGQRIGKASEIEGGGGAVPPPPAGSPPAAPSNPRISLSDPQMLLSGFSPIVLVVTVGGLVLVRRKRRP